MFVCLVGFLSLVSSWEHFSPRVPPREASLLFPEKGLSTWPTHRLCLASHHYCVAERVFFFNHCLSSFQAPADRIYWLSCSGDTVVEGPKKLGTANLASWYYNQQTPKSTLLSVSTFGIWPDLFSAVVTDVLSHQPAFEEFVQIHGWVSKAFTKKTLQMFKWFRNSQLTLFAWPSPYKAW